MEAWAEYDWKKLERAWGTLHEVYRCILGNEGGNTYQLIHTGITARQTAAADPVDRIIPIELVTKGRLALNRLRHPEV